MKFYGPVAANLRTVQKCASLQLCAFTLQGDFDPVLEDAPPPYVNTTAVSVINETMMQLLMDQEDDNTTGVGNGTINSSTRNLISIVDDVRCGSDVEVMHTGNLNSQDLVSLGIVNEFRRRDSYTVCWQANANDTTSVPVPAGQMTFDIPYVCTLGKVCVIDYAQYATSSYESETVYKLVDGTACGVGVPESSTIGIVTTQSFYEEEEIYVHIKALNASAALNMSRSNADYYAEELNVYDWYNASTGVYGYNYSEDVRHAVLGVNESTVAYTLAKKILAIPTRAGVYALCRNVTEILSYVIVDGPRTDKMN